MTMFELRRLPDHREETLLTEIRRVAALIPSPIITTSAFDKLACITSSGLRHRFGSWRSALERAGFLHRYCEPSYSPRKGGKIARHLSDNDILAMLNQVAVAVGRSDIKEVEFYAHTGIHYAYVRKRFGSWRAALDKAGLEQHPSSSGRRYTDDQCFENLLTVWTYYGRPPAYREMRLMPSTVGPKAYIVRWGTWTKALHAFVKRANADVQTNGMKIETDEGKPTKKGSRVQKVSQDAESRRDIRLGLRWTVLERDHFRCVKCGRSPANTLGIKLHVDHIRPFSLGGKTVLSNLQTKCAECNIGKGATLETT